MESSNAHSEGALSERMALRYFIALRDRWHLVKMSNFPRLVKFQWVWFMHNFVKSYMKAVVDASVGVRRLATNPSRALSVALNCHTYWILSMIMPKDVRKGSEVRLITSKKFSYQ